MNSKVLEEPRPTKSCLKGHLANRCRTGSWSGGGCAWTRSRLRAAVILLIACPPSWLPTSHHHSFQGTFARLAMVGTPGHVFGNDEQGRDMLTRLMYGGRMSAFVSA